MAFRLRPRLRRREAIGTVNAPQPVEGIFVAGIAAVRPDIRAVYRDKIGHLMLRLPGAAVPSAVCGEKPAEHPASVRQAMPESSHPLRERRQP